MNKPKHVVIIGGGFAGINAAKRLAKEDEVTVTLIDRRNHHLFQPLLYQVAMAAISPADIAVPIRSILSGYDNIDVLLGVVTDIDLKNRKVHCDFGDLDYDYLISCAGATHSYFGNDQWEDYAPGLKSLEEATEIRKRMLIAYELAERETDPARQKELLTFVIVGGGPTGVELAGALGEISRYTLERDFRNIDPRRTRIILVEGASRILNQFSEEMSEHASRELERLGVTIWTNSMVSDVDDHGVVVGEEVIRAQTILWAAGVRPTEINYTLDTELDRGGRVKVQSDLSLEKYPEVFVVGDQASFAHTRDGKPLPGLAPVAIQQGRLAGTNILRTIAGKTRKPFFYKDKGIMATIGRASAVLEVGKFKISGFFAWIAWLIVHIYYLIGFRNRMMVLVQWAWSYMTVRRGARLITSKIWKTREWEMSIARGNEGKLKKRVGLAGPAGKKTASKSVAGKKSASRKSAKKKSAKKKSAPGKGKKK
ncbi:MAG: NAD(P)/FAD-dependent oxidoreductase [Leptospiraceae bacterium]|nr:NAD(P)/FAD-dependent oxidoreductase [Leptospiraceae bacterium]